MDDQQDFSNIGYFSGERERPGERRKSFSMSHMNKMVDVTPKKIEEKSTDFENY